MFAESIENILKEFIYAANQCIEGKSFVRDERYDNAISALTKLPNETLDCYLGVLRCLESRSPNAAWQKIVYRFKLDLEVL